ncbi:pilus assembly protein [Metapseudomonas otitidis]|uniref:pilus assembly protein n=1 Tax=Metapseudomonas otitidis TaxID=319939 RepID=UPI001AAF8579|nr:PilC/PilY family type IV pilus protein [Pseudomonas otitidis]MBO2929639.1 pilus assembly protein PilY [Pseudomonas otitidis]
MTIEFNVKSILSAGFSVVILLSAEQLQAAALTISQQPLFLNESVDPNILVTIDDSGSMAFAYAPDAISANKARVYFKSSAYNPMYYNPSVVYKLPKKVTVVNGNLQVSDYPAPSFTAAWRNGFTQAGSVNLSNAYRATVEYGRGYDEETGNFSSAYYYNYVPSGCANPSLTNEACYKLVTVGAAEQSNFAIWYSFYRTRSLSTQSAASLAFYSLPENVRVTWQVLNNGSCNNIGSGSAAGNCFTNYLRPFSGSHRANFYSFLERLTVTGGTPLRSALQRAGSFLSKTGVNGPYAAVPGTSSSPEYACRPTYNIMMTDGLWNGDTINIGNYDNVARTLPDGTSYTAKAPYKDEASNTLADLAFQYWATDARPDLANRLAPYAPYKNADAIAQYFDPRNNPATWQHMVTYTLGLGLTTSLTNPRWGGSTFSGDYSQLSSGGKVWPNAADNSANNVYDLWHAAINGRGEFFSVDSPDAMAEAFSTILSRIADRDTSAAAVSLESAVTTAGNEAYYARFSSQNWSGQLIKYDVVSDSLTGGVTLSPSWDARDTLNAQSPASRNIKFASGGQLRDFLWSNLSTVQRALLQKDEDGNAEANSANAQLRVSYIRGDRSNEGTVAGRFRERTAVLGDIIYSSPVIVAKPDSLPALMDRARGVVSTASEVQSYADFLSAQSQRSKRIYVGANDGMLHGFDENGIERFAFIPTAVLDKLYLLSGQSYKGTKHRFFVDGTPVVSDVLINNQWRTILIGTLRAGGRSVFALDVTEPGDEKLLWEFSDSTDGDLGYTFTRPVVTKLHDGNWGVVLSNGYNSTNDKAVLFVLNASTGAVIKKFVLPTGNAVNGLSSPRVADINGDLIADYVYAGDLQGNVWRFDLFASNLTNFDVISADGSMTNGSSSDWRIAFNSSPLFVATVINTSNQNVRQPITAAPTLIRHPSGKGFIVTFGTGKYVESSDAQADTSKNMTLYGVWDTQTAPTGTAVSSTPTLTRTNLVEQTVSTRSSATFTDLDASTSRSLEYRIFSRNPVQWFVNGDPSQGVNRYGWYIDLKEGGSRKGEMLTTDLTARANVLIATTTIPNTDPCEAGIDRWVNAIDGVTGGATSFNVFDLTGNNYVTAEDSYSGQVVSSIRTPGYGSPSVVGQDAFINEPDGIRRERLSFGELSKGRQSWRVVEE